MRRSVCNGRYILNDRKPVEEPDLMAWGRWMEGADRRVALTEHVLFAVSTVFLGLDHRFVGRGPPILFETMAFHRNTTEDIDCARYATWDDALAGHNAMVRRMLKIAEEAAQLPPLVRSSSPARRRHPPLAGRDD